MCLVVDRKATVIRGAWRRELRTDVGSDEMPLPNTAGGHG